jgi:NADPH-dependent curcumin reductase CurA
MLNHQILLAARPTGFPKGSDFRLVESAVPEPSADQFLVRAVYLSVDPYMRGRMNDRKSYVEPVAIGAVMGGESVGQVIRSKHDKFVEGSYVVGQFGWQEYAISDGRGVRQVDPAIAPISTALHILGMPGLTAYFCLFDTCQFQAGETVVVSGAAGAVGSTVGQLVKLTGGRAVGIAGSDEKIDWITNTLGFDAGLNYKTTDNYYEGLKPLCPDGIDVYYDNVGGPITDAVFPLLNLRARVGICGQISQYNLEEAEQGPRILWHMIVKRATIRGFLVFDYFDRAAEGLGKLAGWLQEGKLQYRERITDGLENAPQAFIEMLQGANTGKQLVRISS